jgi:hypothetical protein
MTTPGLVNGVWQGWTLRDTPEGAFEGVAYGNGLFVAVAGSTSVPIAMVSSDGTTWTQSNTVPNNDWVSVAYGNNLFVALSSGGHIMTTQDGINWTVGTTLPGPSGSQIAFGNGLFVTSGLTSYQSTDGINWTQCNGALYGGICYGDGKFVSTHKFGNSLLNRFAYATWP